MPTKPTLLLGLLLVLYCTAALSTTHLISPQRLPFVKQEVKFIQQSIELLFSDHGYSIHPSKYRSLSIFFDTPELHLLNNNAYLKLNVVERPTPKKKLDEKIIYSADGAENYQVDVKHYNLSKTLLGKHPLFGAVKRKQRPAFLLRLKNDGITSPFRVKEVAKAAKISHVYTLSLAQLNIATITVNEVESVIFGQVVTFNTLSMQATSNPAKNKEFTELYASLLSALEVNTAQVPSNEYSALHNQINKHVSYFHWLLKYPFINKILSSFTIGGFGALVIYLIFQQRNRKIKA